MQKKRNDVKARTTLLLSLPDEHQLRFSKYKTAKELWDAILKTFGDIEKDDLKQKFLTILAPEWLIHTIVWRNRNDLDSMSLDYLYNHLKVYEAEVKKKPNINSQDMAFISSSKNINNEDGNTVCVTTASTAFPTGSVNVATISQDTASAFIAFQRRVQRETNRSQNHSYKSSTHRSAGHRPNGAHMRPPLRSSGPRPHGDSMRSSFRPAGHRTHGPSMNPRRPTMKGARPCKSFFQAPSYETRPFLKSSAVKTPYRAPWVPTINMYDPPVNRKFSTGRRNFPTPNRKFPTASRKFTTGSTRNHTADMGRNGKAIKGLEFSAESKNNKIKRLTNELEELKKEKKGLDSKLIGFQSAYKDLDTLLGSQKSDKNKEGLGYSVVPPSCSTLLSSQKGYVLDMIT
nr:hypothetical protein [Tanacetum cinerariifolium]